MPPTTETPTPDLGRRRALGLLAGAGVATLVAACGSSSDGDAASGAGDATTTTTGSSGTGATTATTAASAAETTAAGSGATTVEVGGAIPQETGGPFPADGTNGPNVLTESGVVRSDITSSFGSATGTAAGVPLTIELTVADAATGAVMPGAAVYLWHCTAEGEYTRYQGAADANHLRGVQVADDRGRLTFESIFPGAYSGRWPHIHFHVFSSLDEATTGRNAIRTSQLALPEEVCEEVYNAGSGYESSVQNLEQSSLSSDMVFRDGVDLQLATTTGDPSSGYTASLVVGI